MTISGPAVPSSVASVNQIGGVLTKGHDDFSGRGTSNLTVADSGQTYTLIDSTTPGSHLSIVAGAVTNTASAATAAAGYAQLPAAATVTRIAADIAFTAGSGGVNGAACLPIWATDLSLSYPVIPDTDCHPVITPTQCIFSIWRANSIIQLATINWAPTFTWGTGVFRHVEVHLFNGLAVIIGPDGLAYFVADSRIGATVNVFPTIEVYALNASTDRKCSFRTFTFDVARPFQASSGILMPTMNDVAYLLGRQAQLGPASVPKGAAVYYPLPAAQGGDGLDHSVAVTTAQTAIANLAAPAVVAPSSGKIQWDFQGYYSGTAGPLYIGVKANGTAIDTQHAGTVTGLVHIGGVAGGLTPGASYTIQPTQFSTGTTLTLNHNQPNGHSSKLFVQPVL